MKKVKNKKVYRLGLICLVMCVIAVFNTFRHDHIDLTSLFISVVSIVTGTYWIHASFDAKKANQVLTTVFDEREEYVELKVRSRVYAITRMITFSSIVVLGILYEFNVLDQQLLLIAIITLIFVYFIMLFTYVITYSILERKL